MFISKKHIPRRTFLRGAGVTLALPLLDAMVPAATAAGADRGDAEAALFRRLRLPRRRARLLDSQDREPDGRGAALPLQAARTLQEADRDLQRSAFAIGRAPSGRDRRRSLGRGGVPLRQQAEEDGGRRCLGVQPDHRSDDRPEDRTGQRCCRRCSSTSRIPGPASSNCGEGYSCAYTNSISWVSASQPLPMELNPQVVFERMFGDGSTAEQRAARRERDRSILDSLGDSLSRLRVKLSAVGQAPHRRIRGRHPRNRAAAADRHAGVDGGAGRDDRTGRRAADLRRAHQAAVRSAGAGVPRRHDPRRHVELRPRSHRPHVSRERGADLRASTAPRTTAKTRGASSITRKSTSTTSRCWRTSSTSWPRPRMATGRSSIIRSFSTARTWATPISTCITMCPTCWLAA